MPQTNPQTVDQTTYLQILSRVSRQLFETWQQSDPGSALTETLTRILREVDEIVIPNQKISASVYVYDDIEGFYSGVARGPLADYMKKYSPRTGGTAEFIVRNRQPLFVDNVKRMPPGVPPLSDEALKQGIQSLANLPLLFGPVGQETVVGTLIINLQQPHVFDENQQTLLKLFAGQAAIVLQNARVHRRRLLEETAIQQVSALATTNQSAQVEDYIARQAVELTRATYATLWAVHPERPELYVQGRYNTGRHWDPPQTSLPVDDHSINGYVAQTRREYYADDLQNDPHYARWHSNIKAAMCVPLLVRDELIGTLYVASQSKTGIVSSNRDFIRRLAPHAAVALHDARLFEQEQTLRHQAQALQNITSQLLTSLDPAEVGSVILSQLKQVVPYHTASLQRIYPDGTRKLFAANGFPLDKARPYLTRPLSGDLLVAEIVESKRAVFLPDVTRYQSWDPGLPKVKSWVGVPLILDDHVIGLLTLDHHTEGFFTEQAFSNILTTFASHAALAVRNAETLAREKRRNRDLEALNQSALKLGTLGDEQAVYQSIVDAVVNTLRCDFCTVFCWNPDANRLESVASNEEANLAQLSFAPGQGLTGLVFATGQPLIVPRSTAEPNFVSRVPDREEQPRAMLLTPLRRGEQCIGVVSADHSRPGAFDEEDLRLLTTLTGHASAVLQNMAFLRELRAITAFQQAISDVLPVDKQLEQIRENLGSLMDVSGIFIALYDKPTQNIMFPLAYHDGRQVPHDQKTGDRIYSPCRRGERRGVTEWVLDHKQSLLVVGPDDWTNWAAEIDEKFRQTVQSTLVAPMLLKDESIGVIGLQNFNRPNMFTPNHRRVLETVAAQAAIALDNARLYDEIENNLEQRIAELVAVTEFQRRISSISPVQEELQNIYSIAAETLSRLMDTRNMYIALYNESSQMIEFALVREDGEPPPSKKMYDPRKLGDRNGLTEWVIRHKKSLLIENDFDAWAAAQADVEVFTGVTQCWLGAPMIYGDRVIGVIGLQNFEEEGVFNPNHRRLLEMIASQSAIAIDNARKLDRRIAELQAISQFQQKIINISAE